MTIIIFLVDTSASMNQRTYLGTSLLDVAKGAVETFMKASGEDLFSSLLEQPGQGPFQIHFTSVHYQLQF